MGARIPLLCALALAVGAACFAAQPATGPVSTDRFHTQYVRLGSNDTEGLLYEPVNPGPKSRIALVLSFPGNNNFNSPPGRELASRGYRILMVNYHGEDVSPEVFAPAISRGIEYLRTLPGVQRVVIIGHSGGGHLLTFYENVAEHGPAACQGSEKIYPCRGDRLKGLAKPDGIVLLDPAPGSPHKMSSIDPAVNAKDGRRDAALDMFSAANGFEAATGRASYAADFAKRYYAAQAAANKLIVDRALERLQAIEQGKGQFSDDEPFTVPGMSDANIGARLYHADLGLLSHTKKPHTLLKADGSAAETIVQVVRSPTGLQAAQGAGTLRVMGVHTTVREFLANSAVRTTAGYGFTADDITGIDWKSSNNSTPGNAYGITVPALVLTMGCHYLVVPDEIIYDHLASKDKTFAAVEGAVHEFTPCGAQYGDTVRRTFDFVDSWLSKADRF